MNETANYKIKECRIKAHFLTCYLALLIFRLLEKKLDDKFTCEQIIDSIREYNFLEISKKGYIPAYECSEIYDCLHNVFGFYNDKEIISYDQMNKIIKSWNIDSNITQIPKILKRRKLAYDKQLRRFFSFKVSNLGITAAVGATAVYEQRQNHRKR